MEGKGAYEIGGTYYVERSHNLGGGVLRYLRLFKPLQSTKALKRMCRYPEGVQL